VGPVRSKRCGRAAANPSQEDKSVMPISTAKVTNPFKSAVVGVGFLVAGLAPSAALAQAAPALPTFEGPILVTSIGQSLDAFQVQLVTNRLGVPFEYHPHEGYDDTGEKWVLAFEPSHIADFKTLFLVVGASLKGFGEAGITVAEERARAQAMLAAAEMLGVKVVMFHPGGAERRDVNSDQLLTMVAPQADAILIDDQSDADMFIAGLAAQNMIPIVTVETPNDLAVPLRQMFGLPPA
jgi:hypothetical protein